MSDKEGRDAPVKIGSGGRQEYQKRKSSQRCRVAKLVGQAVRFPSLSGSQVQLLELLSGQSDGSQLSPGAVLLNMRLFLAAVGIHV